MENKMKGSIVTGFLLLLFAANSNAQQKRPTEVTRFETYCNPVDLPYRFRLDGVSRREAADPTMILYHGEYWLFASKLGGYFHSMDLRHWKLVPMNEYPFEEWAPTALVMHDHVYLAASAKSKLFEAVDLGAGKWKEVGDFGQGFGDPDLFQDDDGQLYMVHGLSNIGVIQITGIDQNNGFKPGPTYPVPSTRGTETRGWEVQIGRAHV